MLLIRREWHELRRVAARYTVPTSTTSADVQDQCCKMFIYSPWVVPTMPAPKGLKTTSSPIQISAEVLESAPNTLTIEQIPLTLNVLDNEVFVITQVNIDSDAPDFVFAGAAPGSARRQTNATLSTTERTTLGSIADSNVIAAASREVLQCVDATPLVAAVAFDREDPQFSAISEDYLAIVATNNMFLNIESFNNINAKSARVRVYGYRASASAAVYASLVQSELLSE